MLSFVCNYRNVWDFQIRNRKRHRRPGVRILEKRRDRERGPGDRRIVRVHRRRRRPSRGQVLRRRDRIPRGRKRRTDHPSGDRQVIGTDCFPAAETGRLREEIEIPSRSTSLLTTIPFSEHATIYVYTNSYYYYYVRQTRQIVRKNDMKHTLLSPAIRPVRVWRRRRQKFYVYEYSATLDVIYRIKNK